MKSENNEICLCIDKNVKEGFESCISLLSDDLHKEMLTMNDYLLGLKTMKFKRRIEGNSQACKITYVSSVGFSYSVYISGNLLQHSMWWYMLSNYKYQNKFMGRINDYTEAMLHKLAETSPEFAEKMFHALKECVACGYDQCSARTIYEYGGKKKATCHGKMEFNMNIPNFMDIRQMIATIEELVVC